MLTQEQIKNLKPGDNLILNCKFNYVDNDGDIWTDFDGFSCWFSASSVSLPSEIVNRQSSTVNKYDPTRLFKKGDKVRIVKYNGRKFNGAPPTFQLGKVYRVDEDEDTKHCYVMLQSCDIYYAHPVAFLELVTPVEELEPYSVEEETAFADDEQYGIIHIYYNYNGGRDKVRTFYENGPESWNATKAAAEAECARLNEEWRKEQNNE